VLEKWAIWGWKIGEKGVMKDVFLRRISHRVVSLPYGLCFPGCTSLLFDVVEGRVWVFAFYVIVRYLGGLVDRGGNSVGDVLEKRD